MESLSNALPKYVINLKKRGAALLVLFFILMLTLPASFQPERGALLAILVLCSLRKANLQQLRFSSSVAFLTILNIVSSIVFFFSGIIQKAPGATSVTTVFIIWPVLYLYFIGHFTDPQQIPKFLKAIVWGGIICCFITLLFILDVLGYSPLHLTDLEKAQDFSVYFESGAFKLNGLNQASVMYVFGFSFTLFFLPASYFKFSKVFRRVTLFAMIASAIVIFISGRRAFWVVCALTPVIIVPIFALAKVKISFKRIFLIAALVGVLIICVFTFLAIDNEWFMTTISSIFEFNNPDAESNYLRHEQYAALINGWYQHPIWGAGLGAAAVSSVRDADAPWSYELSYIALLFQTGVLGILIYGGSVIWIYFKSIVLCRQNKQYAMLLLPQLVALSGFLFANATNPYLAKFDYLWVIFLPVATINSIMIYNSNNVNKKLA